MFGGGAAHSFVAGVMSDTFTVQIKMPARNSNLSVELRGSMNVRQAKEAIAACCDTPADLQRLIFAGRVLKDNQIVSECSRSLWPLFGAFSNVVCEEIVAGVTVHMVPVPSGNTTAPPVATSPSIPTNPASPSFPQGPFGGVDSLVQE